MAIVGSYAGQSLLDRSGVRTVAAFASVLLVFACLLLTQISAEGSYFADLFWGLSLFGMGLGAGTVAASVAALADVPDQDAGVASATNTAAFQLGGAFGAAVVTTVVLTYTDGTNVLGRLMAGFEAGFVTCSVVAALALLVGLVALGRRPYRFQPAAATPRSSR